MLTRKMFESRVSEMPFPRLWGEILQISDGQKRKRHCDISEALANVFALQPGPGGPYLAHWGWGPRVRPVRAHSSYATEFVPGFKGYLYKLLEKPLIESLMYY